jgi:hypothetical protein
MTTPILAALTTLAVHLGGQLAAAPEAEEPYVPKGTVEAAPATTGSTEVEGQGKFAAAAEADAREATDATELDVATGGVLSTGNAFAASITGQGRFRLRRGIHQLAAQVAGNYGYGSIERHTVRYEYQPTDPEGPVVRQEDVAIVRDPTIANVQGMLRYDAFFAKRWSAFAMATARRDRFQGLDLRLNVDPGVAFHVLADAGHRLWFEAGYDFQYDRRRQETIFETRPVDPPAPDPDDPSLAATERVRLADDTLVNHAARLFVGYNNSLSDRVTIDTGLEYLQSVLVAKRFRVNWVSALGIQLAGRVGVAVTFTLRYENQPLPTIRPLDTITAVLLTMRFI